MQTPKFNIASTTKVSLLPVITDSTMSDQEKIDGIVKLLKEGASLAEKSEAGETLLHWVCLNGKEKLFDWLCNNNESLIQEKSARGTNVLFFALKFNNRILIQHILQTHFDLFDVRNNGGYTPFHFAVMGDCIDFLDQLLSTYYPQQPRDYLTYENNDGLTLIHTAAYEGHLNSFKFMLNYHEDINRTASPELTTPLFIAVEQNQTEIVEYILKNDKTSVNMPNDKGLYPIHRAALNNNLDILKLFVANDADINECVNDTGLTPLAIAVVQNQLEVVEFILAKDKTSLTIHDPNYFYPIHLAAFHGWLEIFELLNTHTPEKIYEGSSHPLFVAIRCNQAKIVEFLIKKDKSLVNKRLHGRLPTEIALENYHTHIYKLLIQNYALKKRPSIEEVPTHKMLLPIATIENQADIMSSIAKDPNLLLIEDDEGMLPIYRAAMINSPTLLEYCLNMSTLKNSQLRKLKLKALKIAVDNNCHEVIVFLHGNDNTLISSYDSTIDYSLAYIAAEKSNYKLLKFLIDVGADFTQGSYYTPLGVACANGAIDCVKLLLEKNAFLNWPVLMDQNPLVLAISYGRLKVITLLFEYEPKIKKTYEDVYGRSFALLNKHHDKNLSHYIADAFRLNVDCNFETAKKILELLVAKGIDIHDDLNGETILFPLLKKCLSLSRESQREDIAKLIAYLIEQGIDLYKKNDNGVTAVESMFENISELHDYMLVWPLLEKITNKKLDAENLVSDISIKAFMRKYPIDLTLEIFPTRFHLYLDSVRDVAPEVKSKLENGCLYLPIQQNDAEQNLLYIKAAASLLIITPSYFKEHTNNLKKTMFEKLSIIEIGKSRSTIELLLDRKPKTLSDTELEFLSIALHSNSVTQLSKDEMIIDPNNNSTPILTSFFDTKINISESKANPHKRISDNNHGDSNRQKQKK